MMEMRKLLVNIATVIALLTATGSPAAIALEELRSANLAEVKSGVRLGRLLHHSVINDQREMIGSIAEFVVGTFRCLPFCRSGVFLV
jgi:hypothetical protein